MIIMISINSDFKTQTIHQGVAVQQTLPHTLSLADHQVWFPHFHNDILYILARDVTRCENILAKHLAVFILELHH